MYLRTDQRPGVHPWGQSQNPYHNLHSPPHHLKYATKVNQDFTSRKDREQKFTVIHVLIIIGRTRLIFWYLRSPKATPKKLSTIHVSNLQMKRHTHRPVNCIRLLNQGHHLHDDDVVVVVIIITTVLHVIKFALEDTFCGLHDIFILFQGGACLCSRCTLLNVSL